MSDQDPTTDEQPESAEQRQPLTNFSDVPPALWALVLPMIAIELVLSAADAGFIGDENWRLIAISYGAFWKPLFTTDLLPMHPAQPAYMFLSHAFLHGGLTHLVMNSVIILALGKFIAEAVGSKWMLILFALSAIIGAAFLVALPGGDGPAVGASGAAFGFLALWLYWQAMMERNLKGAKRPLVRTIVLLTIANIALMYAMPQAIAWQAHLGGTLVGLALAPLMTRIA